MSLRSCGLRDLRLTRLIGLIAAIFLRRVRSQFPG